MRVVITGAEGQLATELLHTIPKGVDAFGLSIDQCDITCTENVVETFNSISPNIVINTAAWTDVDGAESNVDASFLVNEAGARNIAMWATKNNAYLIHISTDFVFDGKSDTPYLPTDTPCPINVYGESKLAGETAVQDVIPDNSLIVRTAWLYSQHGHNFLNTMLRLFSERDEVRVVNDQIGSPTWARDLANAIWSTLETKPTGIAHWVNGGEASWFDFASAIYTKGLKLEIVKKSVSIIPVSTSEWAAVAHRPNRCILSLVSSSIPYPSQYWGNALSDSMFRCKITRS